MVTFAERFVLEREIGSGGMSRVFLGRDEILDRPVAVKILKSDLGETDIGARFRREGRTAAKLSHPNIVQVYDAGEGEFEGRETSFIVMEYVPGGDLKELIDKHGTLSGGYLTRLSGVAAGLAHAHERGVIHRDIKPHNILLDEGGSPKLADFGIARALDATTATRTGSYLGTAVYSSPEQLRGEGVTPKSDVYSLGIALYHSATGQLPFVGSPIEVANQHVFKDPIPPRELNDAVSESLETLILDCLKKDPDSRPTADEVRLGLVEAGQSAHASRDHVAAPVTGPTEHTRSAPTEPRPGATVGRPATYGSQRRWARGALMALAFVAVLAVIGALAAPTFLGGDGGGAAQNNGEPNPSGGDQAQGEQNPQGGAADQQPSEQQGQGSLTPEAAERMVKDIYTTAAEGDYGASYALLSEGFKQSKAPTPAAWSGQFDTLQSIEFVEGPKAQASENTATVTGVTIARHTDRTERNTVTWTLVNEGGEWRLDGINLQQQELL